MHGGYHTKLICRLCCKRKNARLQSEIYLTQLIRICYSFSIEAIKEIKYKRDDEESTLFDILQRIPESAGSI